MITSIDFIKFYVEEDNLQAIKWDAIVIDESHYLRNSDTKRYKEISKLQSDFWLLLTATPQHTSPKDFYVQLSLFEPSIEEIGFEEIDKFFELLKEKNVIRRLRKNIEEFRDLIPKATFKDVEVEISKEYELYKRFESYIAKESYYYKLISNKIGTIIPFIKINYLNQFTSSADAFICALQKLKNRINETLKKGYIEFGIPSSVDLEDERFAYSHIEKIQELIETGRSAEIKEKEGKYFIEVGLNEKDKAELQSEINTIDGLLRIAEDVKPFSKEEEVIKQIINIRNKGNYKIIVFCMYIKTIDYIYERLNGLGYKVDKLHGTLDKKERKSIIERLFMETDENRIDILITTDVGGVGLNLHSANYVINYDAPWNPMVLQQRIGRVHRIKQRREVFAFNLFDKDTVEKRIYDKLNYRMKDIYKRFDSSDLIISGHLIGSSEFLDLILKLQVGEISEEEFNRKMDELFEKSREYAKTLSELEVIPYLDLENEFNHKTIKWTLQALFWRFVKEKALKYNIESVEIARERKSEFDGKIIELQVPERWKNELGEHYKITFDDILALEREGILNKLHLKDNLVKKILDYYLELQLNTNYKIIETKKILNLIDQKISELDEKSNIKQKLLQLSEEIAKLKGLKGFQINYFLKSLYTSRNKYTGKEEKEEEIKFIPLLVLEDKVYSDPLINLIINLVDSETKYIEGLQLQDEMAKKISEKLKEIKNKEIKKSSRDIIEQLQFTYETELDKLKKEQDKIKEELATKNKQLEKYKKLQEKKKIEDLVKKIEKLKQNYEDNRNKIQKLEQILEEGIIE
ncbi:MAG: helicase-related protein, partial [Methanosarcinales archaeon]